MELYSKSNNFLKRSFDVQFWFKKRTILSVGFFQQLQPGFFLILMASLFIFNMIRLDNRS